MVKTRDKNQWMNVSIILNRKERNQHVYVKNRQHCDEQKFKFIKDKQASFKTKRWSMKYEMTVFEKVIEYFKIRMIVSKEKWRTSLSEAPTHDMQDPQFLSCAEKKFLALILCVSLY